MKKSTNLFVLYLWTMKESMRMINHCVAHIGEETNETVDDCAASINSVTMKLMNMMTIVHRLSTVTVKKRRVTNDQVFVHRDDGEVNEGHE